MVPKVPKDSRHVYWELRDVGIVGQGEAQATCPVKSPGDPLPAGQGCPWGHKPSLEREQPRAEGLGGGVGVREQGDRCKRGLGQLPWKVAICIDALWPGA